MKHIKDIIYDLYMFVKKMVIKIKKYKYAKCDFNKEANVIKNIFDYNKVMEYRPDKDSSYFVSNEYYGTSYILKRYTGYNRRILTAIEHGLPLNEVANEYEYRNNDSSILLVSSENRKKCLERLTDKQIVKFGPLIHYARPILNSFEIENIKHNLGKTLVIFPMHSIEDIQFQMPMDKFIKYVETIKEKYNFNTVLVSAYYIDIQRGIHIPYLNHGWQIVTSGNRMNYDFMDIQKTIITIADGVICQGYSSALGYSIYMNTPASIYFENLEATNDKGEKLDCEVLIGEDNIERIFSEYTDIITEEQYEYCIEKFGLSEIKKPEELIDIFKCARKRKNYKQ